MKQIDTLRMYETLVSNGMTDKEAKTQIAAMESIGSDLMEWLKEARSDFASQKMVSILGGLILLALTAIGGQLWSLTTRFEIMEVKFSHMDQRLGVIEEGFKK